MPKIETPKINNTRVNGIKGTIQQLMDKLYTSTYMSPPSLNSDLDNIKNSLDKSIDVMVRHNEERPNMNIQAVYQRMKQNKKDSSISGDLQDMFEDKNMIDSLMPTIIQNRMIKQKDEDIDTLCRFVPSLEEALEVKRDHVLTSDHYTKEFMNIVNKSTNDKEELSQFNSKADSIKKRYRLAKLYKDSYYKAAKYGEEYIYITSYNRAFAKLLQANSKVMYVKEDCVTLESYASAAKLINEATDTRDFKDGNNQLKVFFYNNVIPTFVQEERKIRTIQEQVLTEGEVKFDSILTGSSASGFEGIDDDNKDNKAAADGLTDTSVKETDFKLKGAIVRRLKRENVIPIYMNDICLGYYYVECNGNIEDQFNNKSYGMQSTLGFMGSKNKNMFDVFANSDKDDALKFLSSQLSEKIDKNFINNNQDLKEEIYQLLKGNNIFNKSNVTVNVSYISPNEMIPMMFNEDEDTHRGISDLDKAMVPGKLYAHLMTTNTLGIISRGFDKRVYYVKQQIDTNISQVLLNTIGQLKKSNMGMRELSNLKTAVNATGRYNDLLIPVGASGDYPVNFEIMQGQDIDPKLELCESLERQAVDSTGTPYEYVQAESTVDFATRLTMNNVKFLRIILSRQELAEFFFTLIFLKIWEAEGEDATQDIQVSLISPTYLSLVNNSELYRGMSDYADAIVANHVVSDDDKLKATTKKNIIKTYLSGQLDMDLLQKIIEDSKTEYDALPGKKDE